MLDLAILTIFPAAVAFAGAMDLFTLTIPNRISLVLIAGFYALAPFIGLSLEDIAWHTVAGLCVLAITFGMFVMGWFGGGDAKLLAAIALWVGFGHLLDYIFVVAIAGGVIASAFELFRSGPLPVQLAHVPWAQRLHNKNSGIPYGLALAAGALIVYPHTPWFTGVAG